MSETSVAARAIDLVKVYGRDDAEVYALGGVSLDINASEFTAVMGPSGSGKSTFMHCMAALDTPSSGSVMIGDIDVAQLGDKELTELRRDRIGFVFQAFNLVPTLTAEENIVLPLAIAGREPDRQWFDTVIDAVGLRPRLGHRPTELSGGQQQRVACARALVSRPSIVFADEPTGNLDSTSGAEVLGFLRRSVDEFKQTVVMVTHDAVAASYTDRVVFLADGKVVDELHNPTPEAVLSTMAGLQQKAAATAGTVVPITHASPAPAPTRPSKPSKPSKPVHTAAEKIPAESTPAALVDAAPVPADGQLGGPVAVPVDLPINGQADHLVNGAASRQPDEPTIQVPIADEAPGPAASEAAAPSAATPTAPAEPAAPSEPVAGEPQPDVVVAEPTPDPAADEAATPTAVNPTAVNSAAATSPAITAPELHAPPQDVDLHAPVNGVPRNPGEFEPVFVVSDGDNPFTMDRTEDFLAYDLVAQFFRDEDAEPPADPPAPAATDGE